MRVSCPYICKDYIWSYSDMVSSSNSSEEMLGDRTEGKTFMNMNYSLQSEQLCSSLKLIKFMTCSDSRPWTHENLTKTLIYWGATLCCLRYKYLKPVGFDEFGVRTVRKESCAVLKVFSAEPFTKTVRQPAKKYSKRGAPMSRSSGWCIPFKRYSKIFLRKLLWKHIYRVDPDIFCMGEHNMFLAWNNEWQLVLLPANCWVLHKRLFYWNMCNLTVGMRHGTFLTWQPRNW